MRTATYYEHPASFIFTDTLFRENTATMFSMGTDLCFNNIFPSEVSTANFERCDSSSSGSTIYFYGDDSSDTTLLTPVSLGFAILSCSVSHSETESTVTVTTLNAVSGVMSVLLSGGLVPRLVFVTFESTGSKTGTGTTTTDVLPSTNEYSLEAAALAGYKPESSLLLADASLIDPNTTKIDLAGTKLVSGSYSMLVKDASGTPTNISLTLSSSTKLSTTVSLYPISSAELKYGTEYEVMSVLRGTTSLTVRDGLSFTTPDEPARIVGIWIELDASGNTTLVTVRGRQIAKGSYTVRLNSESGPWFDISFSDEVIDERNSSVATVSIFGDSPGLSFGTTYALFSVVPTSSPSTPLLIDANPNSFKISEPSRITDVSIGDFSDAQKTEAILTMSGRALKPNTDYVMHVTGHPKSTSLMTANAEPDKRTITIRTDSTDPSESGSKTIKFYPLSSAELLFGYEYIVDSVTLDGSTLLQNSGLSFTTPFEPSYISSIESHSLTASKDSITVIVKGLSLKQSSTLMIVESSDGDEIESDGEIDVKSESECWITFKVGWEENTTHLEFLKTYTLVGGRGGSSELIITPELSFTVPSGPIVTSISAPLTCSSSSFSVGIVGTDLPIETGFKVELVGGLSFLVDFSSSTEGNGTISASLPGQMQFDTSYSVTSVTNGDRKMKCDSVSFRTPLGPTLVDVKASLSTSTVNNVIVTLESVRMPVGKMNLSIKESGSTPIVMEVSFVSSEAGSVEVVVFGGSTLKYGTLYTVVSLRSSSLHCSLDGSITFETPAAPPRIKTASCSLVGELQRSGDIVLTGEALPAGESFSMSLDEIDENGDVIAGTTPITLSDRFDGVIGDTALTTHTLSITLFPVAQLMKYSRRYRITSLTISTVPTVRTAVEETATFKVPAEPARIVGIWVELDSSGNTTLVTVRGRQIAKGSYTVKLNSESGPWFDISFSDEMSDERNSNVASVSIFGDSPVLSFGTTYTLFSVVLTSSPSTPLLIDATPNTFTISEPSRITDVTIGSLLDALKTEATLTMSGRALKPNTDYVMRVTGQPRSKSLVTANTEPDKRTITVRSDSTDPSESGSKTIKFYPLSSADLLFGYEYIVDSVTLDGSTLLQNSGLSFATPTEPARIVGIWLELDVSGNTTSIVLRGRQIAKGSYTVRLNSESGPWFDISFSDEISDERNSNVASISIFGDSPVLSFGTTYTLFSVIPTSSPSTPLLIDATPNTFTISEPSRITDVTIGSLLDALKTEATLTMSGRALKPNTDYVMRVTGQPRSKSLVTANTEPDKRTITVRSDSTDPSESGSKTIKFYPLSSADLLFGYEYIVDSVSLDGSTLLQNSDLSFSTPFEPPRLLSVSPLLAASLETVNLTFGGRCFAVGSFTVKLQVTSTTSGTPFEVACSAVSETELTLTLNISTSDLSSVEFGDVLSVLSLKNDSSSAILEMSTFSIPHPPRVDNASFSFCSDLNTTFSVTLRGTDLPSNERFLVVLDSDHSFEVVFTNSSSGTSKEMAIGWTDSLQYDTEYRIMSIRNEESGKTVFVESSVSFTTEKRPKQIVVFFDSSSSDSSRLCGKKDEPCSSMDSAWKIASNVGASDISLRLILNATLSSPIVCLLNGIVVVEKGTSTEPTLTIPSSASMGENGMISISSGLFEIRDVDVVIESIDPSFVLLSGIDSTIVLRDGSIVGVKTRNSLNSDEVCCEWETGVLQLSNCTTNITETVLSRISQGVVNMRSGTLRIVSSTFFDNSPAISSFPSTRQNIRCSENGEIEIGSLHGGDGTVDHPSAWISATDCEVGGADAKKESLHFIPTLSPTSTSSFTKKDKTFTLEMCSSQ
ncbi:hypothetical protein BLNAU_24836 [Blattamonas nauphoetae]|uniref:Uncharacterized protein n=1 Tax=Blattamonas nauphoetae TaxID=2049346 RepID=A0ABQ9WLB9_9EUKA|nr:hypothetical protein BLNAU_24836 [Blattamonas nauphoetae]